jgi:hypothetical protein
VELVGFFTAVTAFFAAGAGFTCEEAVAAGLAPDVFAPGCGLGLEVCASAIAAVPSANAKI